MPGKAFWWGFSAVGIVGASFTCATGAARGTNARYLCKGDYDDGGQYCIGFGGALVDRRLGQELLKGDLAFWGGSQSEGP